MEKLCFFIGHREAPENLLLPLINAVECNIMEYKVKDFLIGHYGNFDRLAAKAVIDAKTRHPDITLTILLPYHPASQPFLLPDGADGSLYPEEMEGVPKRFAITRANKYAVNQSDCLIAYVQHSASNAQKLLQYAEARQKRGLLQNITRIEI